MLPPHSQCRALDALVADFDSALVDIDLTRCHARDVGPSEHEQPCPKPPRFLVQMREQVVMLCADHRPVRRKMVWPARADAQHVYYLTKVDGRTAVWQARLTRGRADMADDVDPVEREERPQLWAELEADAFLE